MSCLSLCLLCWLPSAPPDLGQHFLSRRGVVHASLCHMQCQPGDKVGLPTRPKVAPPTCVRHPGMQASLHLLQAAASPVVLLHSLTLGSASAKWSAQSLLLPQMRGGREAEPESTGGQAPWVELGGSVGASSCGCRLPPQAWAVCLSPQRPLLAGSLRSSLWAARTPHSFTVAPGGVLPSGSPF